MREVDVLVIGSGISGCTAAYLLAKKGIEVTLVTSASSLLSSNSYFAQGGIIYQGKDDTPELLKKDLFSAGAGLCLPKAVEQFVLDGPKAVKDILIEDLEVPFERQENEELSFTDEAAHSTSRILHYRDHTGKVIMEALTKKLEELENVKVLLEHTAVDLITLAHHSKNVQDIYKLPTCSGAYVLDNKNSKVEVFFAKETILATGGLGEVFLHTTNPSLSRGDGLAMAYRAGARIMNMEYVQFHPTSLCIPNERRFLLTEALRGEGGELLSQNFQPFVHEYDKRGGLAPRDVVARAIYKEMLKTSADHLWLDISSKDSSWVKQRFPTIYEYCLSKGFDMTEGPLPVVPAAHYSCGGIAVDKVGKTSLKRLRAIGEVACTGVHGANRLASASLLEGLLWAKYCAEDIASQISRYAYYIPEVETWKMGEERADSSLVSQDWTSIKQTMWNYVGLIRDTRRLQRALLMLQELKWEIETFYEKALLTTEVLGLRNGVEAALLITKGAIRNKHSMGCHFREN